MKNQAYRMAMLFDFYGDLLTERQREFYDLYYNEDLSLAEIAENYGISRQGVRDVIVRAEASMTEIEDKTHIIRRFQQSRAALAPQALKYSGQLIGKTFKCHNSYSCSSLATFSLIVRASSSSMASL